MTRLAHTPAAVAALRAATPDDPLRVLVSGCLAGLGCGVDGSDNGVGGALGGLLAVPSMRFVAFCPEAHTLGVPRTLPDIHGGDGADVLAGRARVYDEHGVDLTDAMVAGGEAMVSFAREHDVELAILTDMSAACGTQVIAYGCRLTPTRAYQAGTGVAAALLLRAGVPVVSQRDYRTLGSIRARLDPAFTPDPAARDHHQTPWYEMAFPVGAPRGPYRVG
ncbi:MAG: DUF523 domain-containing protein [Myxococcota bacterium]